jgi:hypothetical protein
MIRDHSHPVSVTIEVMTEKVPIPSLREPVQQNCELVLKNRSGYTSACGVIVPRKEGRAGSEHNGFSLCADPLTFNRLHRKYPCVLEIADRTCGTYLS